MAYYRKQKIILALAVLLLLPLWFSRSSRADYEPPLVNTTNFVAGNFRSTWGFIRDTLVGNTGAVPDWTSTSGVNSYYQAWAAGATSDGTQPVLYQLGPDYSNEQRRTWQQILPNPANPAGESLSATIADFPPLNVVSGLSNMGNGDAMIWIAGQTPAPGKELKIFKSLNARANFPTPYALLNDFKQETVIPAGITQNIYALQVSNEGSYAIAGGENGLLLKYTWGPGGTPGTWTKFTNIKVDTSDVLGIIYPVPGIAYVVTSDLPAGVSPYSSKPINCGSSNAKLFIVTNDPAIEGNWTQLGSTKPGVCFFSVTTGVKDAPTGAGHGPLATNVWVAASDGVYRFNEEDGSLSRVKTTTEQLYGISAVQDRGGDGQNMLFNGNLEAWDKESIDEWTAPSGWGLTDENVYGRHNPGGGCGRNTMDIMANASTRVGQGWEIKLEPWVYYPSAAKCTTGVDAQTNASSGVFAMVDMSTLEGTKFKVSGDYKVVFTNPGTTTTPQGGVAIGCAGALPSIKGIPGYDSSRVDCSFSNTSEIRTYSMGDSSTDLRRDSSGYIHFEKIVSRQDEVFSQPILGATGNPKRTGRNSLLQISCEGTYGAQVFCDNLRVEPVNTPAIASYDRVAVYAVGQKTGAGNTLTLTNRDAINSNPAKNIFTDENNVFASSNLQSIWAVNTQHVYAVGENNQIVQRSPGNVTGFMWAGTATADSSGAKQALGWISASCANNQSDYVSLCQKVKESYGMNFENGLLSGRAWLGKQYDASPMTYEETLDLGTCVGAARRDGLPASEPYRMGYGICIPTALPNGYCSQQTSTPCTVNNETTTCQKSCNTATRTCVKDQTKSCVRDFDCYGHCSRDAGFICLTDADCRIQSADPDIAPGGRMSVKPRDRIDCTKSGASPLACTNAGWLSFNPDDFTGGADPVADSFNGVGNAYNATTGGISGWARFITLASRPRCKFSTSCIAGPGICCDSGLKEGQPCAGDLQCPSGGDNPNAAPEGGWVRLRGGTSDPVYNNFLAAHSPAWPDALYGCQSCTGFKCRFCQDLSAQSCRPSAANCTKFCDGDLSRPCTADGECGVDLCKAVGFCSRPIDPNNPTQCQTDNDCTTNGDPPQPNGGFCNIGAVCHTGAAGSCNQYGLDFSETNSRFYGYIWSSDYGWIDAHRLIRGTSAYLQTRLGDIYAQKEIGSAETTVTPPGASCNATYLIISSSTITNFCSAYEGKNAEVTGNAQIPNATTLPYAGSSNIYENVLGRFDVVGIETDNDSNPAVDVNKYGQTIIRTGIVNSSTGEIWKDAPYANFASVGVYSVLGRKVYIANCPSGKACQLNKETEFFNGLTTPENGAGILIVNGDLNINKNMRYHTSNITETRQLASLVVVVRGNLTIANEVTNVVGTYYVAGSINTTQGAIFIDSNRYPLTVRGLMIAKVFNFGRRFAGTVENPMPSELFIFDGRMQTNPLPGMVDFVNTLPSTLNSSP